MEDYANIKERKIGMKFIIHSLKLLKEAEALETDLKLGRCYIPGRDTPQTHGEEILQRNYDAMVRCEGDVYVVWDGSSLGTVFDMGMAYALGKTIIPFRLVVRANWPDFFRSKLGKDIKHV